ncbi:response regulator transcription factor [Streptomyces alfalfae]|uniref:Helix-turn-helix transcriptional regulator n=1 Tax=Streptomyces alfalfae TaxID=1642299 RepID=A0A7T4PMK0_9ACTN|nr:helix-turn-helix transcriptional regulator [Streptomyces alfalfae]QQC93038.1 helix-turn-helix transcriptional regulator [Streptomyces alfalfae]
MPKENKDSAAPVYAAQACPLSAVIVAAETGFAAQFGVSPGEIHGCLPSDLLHVGTPESLRQRFTGLCEGHTLWFTEKVIGQHCRGTTFTARLTAGTATAPTGLTGLMLLLSPTTRETPPARTVLTALEARILDGVAAGASTELLAERLCLSRRGVDYHIRQMLRRFDAPNRRALAAQVGALGLLGPSHATAPGRRANDSSNWSAETTGMRETPAGWATAAQS